MSKKETSDFGTHGSSTEHKRYSLEKDKKCRGKCGCGCKGRASHWGMANGVALMEGCQLTVARWVRDSFTNRSAQK